MKNRSWSLACGHLYWFLLNSFGRPSLSYYNFLFRAHHWSLLPQKFLHSLCHEFNYFSGLYSCSLKLVLARFQISHYFVATNLCFKCKARSLLWCERCLVLGTVSPETEYPSWPIPGDTAPKTPNTIIIDDRRAKLNCLCSSQRGPNEIARHTLNSDWRRWPYWHFPSLRSPDCSRSAA